MRYIWNEESGKGQRRTGLMFLVLLCALAFVSSGHRAWAFEEQNLLGDNAAKANPQEPKALKVPEQTRRHWNLGKRYQQQRRYELARQHLLLALAACNTTELRDSLQRDLQIVDLQLRTMR